MSRLDFKSGRFGVREETDSIEHAMRGFMFFEKESIDYWRFNFQTSQPQDIYNENFGKGRDYHPVVNIPCYHVTHIRGGKEDGRDSGFYYNDSLYVVTSYQQFYRSGNQEADILHRYYLKDVIWYDHALFQVDTVNVSGQVSRYGGRTTVSIEASMIKPDEVGYDSIFSWYSNQGSPAPWEK